MCKRNMKFLEIRNSAELTELSAEFAENSAGFFKNSAEFCQKPAVEAKKPQKILAWPTLNLYITITHISF
jgi:hypothetical protein